MFYRFFITLRPSIIVQGAVISRTGVVLVVLVLVLVVLEVIFSNGIDVFKIFYYNTDNIISSYFIDLWCLDFSKYIY